MSTPAHRIARLEATIHTCQTCRPWHEVHQVPIIRPEQWAAMPKVPDVCPACGKPTPDRIRAIVIQRVAGGTRRDDGPY